MSGTEEVLAITWRVVLAISGATSIVTAVFTWLLLRFTKPLDNYTTEVAKQLAKHQKLIGDVRGRGLLLGIELVKDRTTKEHATAECAELMDRCRDKGLLVGKGGLRGNVLRIAPPLTFTRANADFMLKVIDQSLTEVTK